MNINPRSIIHKIPMFRASVIFICGIIVGDMFVEEIAIKAWILLLCVLIGLAFILDRKHDQITSYLILIITLCFGALDFCWQNKTDITIEQEGKYSIWNEYTKYEGKCNMVILSEPIRRGKIMQFDGLVYSTNGEYRSRNSLMGAKLRMSLLRDTITKKYEGLHIGDAITANVELSPLKNWNRINSHFDYIRWLKARGFVCRGFIGIGKWEPTTVSANDIGIWEYAKLEFQTKRQRLIDELHKSGMDTEAFAVATAMTLGNKAALTPEIREEYNIAGASHILALSGMHLSIIYMLLSLLLGKKRVIARLSILGTIWMYVLFVGMPLSLIRAAIMLTIYEIVSILSSSQHPLNVIGTAALLITIANPESIWDVGFQMSFMAVLSIILMMDKMSSWMPESWKKQKKRTERTQTKRQIVRYRVLRSLWYTAAMSLAAQIGTMPLTAYYFGRITLYFIITNFVVIPGATIIVCGTMLLSLIAIINIISCNGVIWLLTVAGAILGFVVKVQNAILEAIAKLPGASIEEIDINAVQVAALYVIIVAITILINWKSLRKL